MSDHDDARLLLSLVRHRWDEAEALARRRPPGAGFVATCVESDVAAWLHAQLADGGRASLVGPEVMGELGARRERVRRDNLLLLARAEQALDHLRTAGVVPVLLKGLDLLHRFHAGFDRRTLDDVDLLVRPAELAAAVAALEAHGWRTPPEPTRTHYVRSSHHLPLRSPGPVAVDFEIHWSLAQELRYRIDEHGLHARAVPLVVGGRPALRLNDHDVVAHLLLHHFTHYFDRRLKWAIDMRAVASGPAFDWSEVVHRVRAWGATAAVGLSLLHLHRLLPGWIPPAVLAQLRPARWRLALLAPLRSGHPLELLRHTRRRSVQLWLALVLLERPLGAPRWLLHRATRDRRPSRNPLDS